MFQVVQRSNRRWKVRTLPPLVNNQRQEMKDELYEIQTILAKDQGNEQAKQRWYINLMLMLKQRKQDQRKRSFWKGLRYQLPDEWSDNQRKEENAIFNWPSPTATQCLKRGWFTCRRRPPCHLWLFSFPLWHDISTFLLNLWHCTNHLFRNRIERGPLENCCYGLAMLS